MIFEQQYKLNTYVFIKYLRYILETLDYFSYGKSWPSPLKAAFFFFFFYTVSRSPRLFVVTSPVPIAGAPCAGPARGPRLVPSPRVLPRRPPARQKHAQPQPKLVWRGTDGARAPLRFG